MLKQFYLLILFQIIGLCYLNCQTIKISGICYDNKKQPLEEVIITLMNFQDSNIIAFTSSDDKGKFEIKIKAIKDSVLLKLAKLNYATITIKIRTDTNCTNNFYLTTKPTVLPNIVLRDNIIYRRKDTINFKANAFAEEQDKVIGDVLKRIPGIEVLDNGSILYQGKGINKFYIDGNDLLEDKYNIATNNVPNGIIDKIQILENHEPKKVLDSFSNSDRAAINLTLKNEAKTQLIATSNSGVGYSPISWKEELTALMFKRKIQFINIYKTNNIGKDIAEEIMSLNISSENFGVSGSDKNLLSIISDGTAPINSSKALFNNAHLFSLNNLMKLNDTYQLRINASYCTDIQTQNVLTNTTYYNGIDTLLIKEKQKGFQNINTFKSMLTLNANSNKFYLDNKLSVNINQNKYSAIINDSINQHLNNKQIEVINEFNYLKKTSKKVLEICSYLNYKQLPEQLIFSPGQYADIINNGLPYNNITQNAAGRYFYSNQYISFSNFKNRIKILGTLGFKTDVDAINTSAFKQLQLKQNISINDSFYNNIHWQNIKPYFNLDVRYGYGHFDLQLLLPTQLNLINIKDETNRDNNKNVSMLIVQPKLFIKYKTKNDFTYTFSAGIANNLGSVKDMLTDFYFANYRYIQNNLWALTNSNTLMNSFDINYTNVKRILFITGSFSYLYTFNSLTKTYQFTTQQLESAKFISSNNNTTQNNAYISISKSYSKIKTTLIAKMGTTNYNMFQIQNGNNLNIINKSYFAHLGLIKAFKKLININYDSKYELNKSDQDYSFINSSNQYFNITQKLDFYIIPTKNNVFALKGEYYYLSESNNKSYNYFFVDLNYIKKLPKIKSQIEFSLNNIMNTIKFKTTNIYNNTNIINEYRIRGRMFFINYYFKL